MADRLMYPRPTLKESQTWEAGVGYLCYIIRERKLGQCEYYDPKKGEWVSQCIDGALMRPGLAHELVAKLRGK